MGADFYPRLVGVATDNAECNRLVNEQAQVSLLLACVGVAATLTFAPLVVALFYSSAFDPAAETLRWICLGMTLRVITWPIGYIIVARNEQILFFLTELAWAIVNVALSWLCIRKFGLRGAGIAFFVSYIFHGLMVYPIAMRLSGFRWDRKTRNIGLFFILAIAIVFVSFLTLPATWAMAIGTVSFLIISATTLRALLRLVAQDRLPTRLVALLRLGRLIP
jgi:enterobacterial common antigen flippase